MQGDLGCNVINNYLFFQAKKNKKEKPNCESRLDLSQQNDFKNFSCCRMKKKKGFERRKSYLEGQSKIREVTYMYL